MNGLDAVVSGIIDSSVKKVTGVPGYPITGLMDALGDKIKHEWSINEKVALEIALGSFADREVLRLQRWELPRPVDPPGTAMNFHGGLEEQIDQGRMEIAAHDEIGCRRQQVYIRRGKAPGRVENPFRQDHVGQVRKQPRVRFGLAETHQFDVGCVDQFLYDRAVGRSERHDGIQSAFSDRLAGVGHRKFVQFGGRVGNIGGLQQIDRKLAHAAALRPDADALPSQLREVIQDGIAPVKNPQRRIENTAEGHQLGSGLRFADAALHKPHVNRRGFVPQAREVFNRPG